MLAAILMCGFGWMLTSCSSDNDDNNVTPPNPGPLAEQLSGR